MAADPNRWPELPYAAWADTAATLQLWTQVVGKVRLALTPWLNHSWHVALYVTARGLTTGPIPDGARQFQIDFDFIDHLLWIRTSDGHFRQLMLKPTPVAEFYADVMIALKEFGIDVTHQHHAVRNRRLHSVRPGYRACVLRRRLRQPVLARTGARTPSDGAFPHRISRQIEPGAFLLGLIRSGGDAVFRQAAPRHPGGVPHLPDAVAQEAYSHEVSSAGFWPGGGAIDYPAFYSYAYPAPEGFAAAR